MEEKLSPPEHKVFDRCPQCGSTRRDGEMEILYRKQAGLLHKDAFPGGGGVLSVPLFDPTHPLTKPLIITAGNLTKIPVMNYHFDRCADCGALYSPKVEVGDQIAQIQPQPQRGHFGNPGTPRR
jgi:hypothetical protein